MQSRFHVQKAQNEGFFEIILGFRFLHVSDYLFWTIDFRYFSM